VNGEVYLFADQVTPSMQALLDITEYRRARQLEYNEKHGITPRSVQRAVQESLHTILKGRQLRSRWWPRPVRIFRSPMSCDELEQEMLTASANLEFEKAALMRDRSPS
jgi:excinuclease ABC subunit B